MKKLFLLPIVSMLMLVLVVLVVLSGCGASSGARRESATAEPPSSARAADDVSDGDPIRIVAMGDSLTEGFGLEDSDQAYPAQLERRLLDDGYNVEVINAGNSGETSTGAAGRVDWLLNLEPDIVILATGGNDGLRGIDPGVTRANLAEITAALQAGNATVVLAGMEMVQNMGEAYTAEFRAAYPAVAEEAGAILIPFFLEGVAADPALNQADFIHPTGDGYAVIVETIYPYIVEALETVQR